ncbi:GPI transamidase component PIG-S-like isoform X2 [Dreissena polymorpha]|uniref:GPI transamidase component PIG-S n=1 Tax=Dreissena polymorpha TaxID=45954 RepID=A0A9D4F096_DREPO|nr:GPI transamidase component PIG-S-like isoform X2 [Dreissena polymorpha]KAH3789016.1 hypothetical protein DPMN_167183 [Dreissena polymorpha]
MVDKEADKKTNVYAAVGVGFVCLVVGLPLWWKTTEVYRVSLPYSDIDTLAGTKIQYTVDIIVKSFLKTSSEKDLAVLSRNLLDQLGGKQDALVKSYYRTIVKAASTEELQFLEKSASLKELDSLLSNNEGQSKPNKYSVFILPRNSRISISKPTFGCRRNVFIPEPEKDFPGVAVTIAHLVKDSLVRESTVLKRYKTARGTRNLKPDKETMRSVRFSSGYDVTLTLVSPRPDILDVQWDAKSGISAYLTPFVLRMSNYTSIVVKSQVLFFTKLHTKPKKENNEFYFTPDDLPHMINPLEAKLGSPASTNPELNFLVYVPSRSEYPLYIHDAQGTKLESNAFFSPQWGGVYIYNVAPPSPDTEGPVQHTLDMSRIMEVFVTELRLLLNFNSPASEEHDVLPTGVESIRDWELDVWLRSRCVENLATSSASLKSLAQLLGKISNIVIKDDIGNEVKTAVAAMQLALDLLRDGDLKAAYLESRRAVTASEKAFFDPSLLELLYFPEDQKFAIYIPLFLPISFPVISSLWQAYKWWRGADKPKTE